MSRGARQVTLDGVARRVRVIACDGDCDAWQAMDDPTDVPITWAARVGSDNLVRHYCPACDPGPSVGKGPAGRRP